jgi:hypothetical protein
MAIGTMLTGFLSRVEFHSRADDWITSTLGTEPKAEDDGGEFYSSLVVMIATGVWCYVLSLYVNAAKPETKKHKFEKDPAKEL